MRRLWICPLTLRMASAFLFAAAAACSLAQSGTQTDSQSQAPVSAAPQLSSDSPVAVPAAPPVAAPAASALMPSVPSPMKARRGSWQDVENLPPGTQISVNPLHGMRFRCVFESANDHELICEPPQPPYLCMSCALLTGVVRPVSYGPIHFDPKFVRDVHIEHPGGNTAIGVAIGAGLGIVLGTQGVHGADRRPSQVVFGLLLGTAGGFIGRHVPIIRGTVVYER
ncbi:MAG TPA: hypothetical protein VGD64_11405 [Acidisarcina sp.]